MNRLQKIGFFAGMGSAVLVTTHLLNKFIFESSIAGNVTGKDTFKIYKWKFGDIHYTVTGEGSPIVLVHDLNVYSSSYEWSKVIDAFAKNHTVYAIDLIGCGHSERPTITYTTFMYTQLLNDFIANVIDSKCDVIATGKSASIAITAAYENASLYNSLIIVNPQSVNEAKRTPDRFANIRRRIINLPIIGTCIYNIQNSRRNLERYLALNVFADRKVSSDYLDACVENSHLGMANSKYLFESTECNYTTVSLDKSLSSIDLNISIISGEQMKNSINVIDEYTDLNPAIEYYTIENTKYLPQFEKPVEFVRQCNIFLEY